MSNVTKRLIAWGARSWVVFLRWSRFISTVGRLRLVALDHVTMPVKDLEEARRFYCDFLGARLAMKVDDETFRRFGRPPAAHGGEQSHHLSVYLDGPTRLDLFLMHTGQALPEHGHPHYAFNVSPRQLLAWKNRLQAHGVAVDGPLQLGPSGQASIYFDDPFGNHLEITCLGFLGSVEIRPPQMERLARPA